ncbi:MAG: ROK family protein [Oceanospirillales bacterium]|mgnify:CR=1 FL=1|uniref:ROK family protein n=1 Tax=Marinobacter maritimus TaxID=277961 RepID=UPI000BCC121B|nr:ROK family protein [Marinobacter maritimus]MBL1273632.1 ROK family protein [Oceanospirillales bacterium]
MRKDWLIGIDLGGTKTEVILMDRQSNEHFRRRVSTPVDYHATLNTIQSLVQAAELKAGVSGLPVGIGIPGSVSGITGKVKNGNSTWLNGQAMQEGLCTLLQRPVTLTNDANCLALSEATDGAGRNHNLVFAAILGTGCGAGISVGARVLTGPNGVAGEWGHNPLAWTPQAELERRPCFCGRHGCNETFLSGTGLSLTHNLLTGQELLSRDIAETALNGDKEAAETLDQYLEHLARGLATVINLLDPDIIVLGGGMSNTEQIYREVPARLAKYVFGGECATPVVKALHGDSSGARGAAWLSL